MIGYKVLFKHKKQLWSLSKAFDISTRLWRHTAIRYYTKKCMHPKVGNGALAVCMTLEAAKTMQRVNSSGYFPERFAIYRCEYEPADNKQLRMMGFPIQTSFIMSANYSADAASSLRLLEKVS